LARIFALRQRYITAKHAEAKTMNRLLNGYALAILLLAACTSALANAPDPSIARRRANVAIPMRIAPDREATEAKLVIPRAIWQQLRAGLDGNDTQSAVAATARFRNLSGAQTAMAGMFLSLAFAFGGVWLVRSRKQTDKLTRVALGVAVLALCSATASIAYANAGPPPVARSLTSQILVEQAQWYGVYGQVKIEIADEGDQITLVLPAKARNATHD
jgi:hypothetical protein